MKKLSAVLLTTAVAAVMSTGFAVTANAATAADLPAEAQFEPNAEYEQYTVVEYTIEDLNADLVCTVCKKGENEYEILTNFYGDDQDMVCEYDGKELKVISDKTGFMEGDSPAIIDKAIEQDLWVAIGEEGAEAAEAAEGEEEAAPAAGEKVVWDVEPQFEPNKEYEVYTVVEYTIEDLNADLVCTVCKKGENEYEILTNFYGDDQDMVCEYDGKELKVVSDKTGFMEGDSPAILDKAIEQDKWANIADDTLVGGEAAEEEAAEETAEGEEAAAGEAADASALPAEPQFEPNKEYEVYTVVEYTIEDLNADLVCTVCKKGENEYEILTNFYGDDQDVVCEYDGKELKVISDKTGFMEGDSPAILDKAIEQNIWVPIA